VGWLTEDGEGNVDDDGARLWALDWLCGVLAHERVVAPIRNGSGVFQHGHTYIGHPVAAVADGGPVTMTGNTSAGALDLVVRLGRMAEQERSAMLADLPVAPCYARMMLAPEELPQLAEFGIALGIHGFTHLPLTEVGDVEGELGRARAAIAAKSEGAAVTDALGLPHSCYNDNVIAAANAAGIKCIFTGDMQLARTTGGMLPPGPTLGRINIKGSYIGGRDHLDPAAAARWLWD